ncbi:MAG TPA: hypothetical protein VN612_02400 [Acidobacteriaceae bacterium]|nr:hypothetical protein [Acidobacteriaceae bacterium]
MGAFVHRDNHPLNCFDSICMQCFRTVGTRKREAELAEDELAHVCRKEDLARLRSLASKSGPRAA